MLSAERCRGPGWIKCSIPSTPFLTCSGEHEAKTESDKARYASMHVRAHNCLSHAQRNCTPKCFICLLRLHFVGQCAVTTAQISTSRRKSKICLFT